MESVSDEKHAANTGPWGTARYNLSMRAMVLHKPGPVKEAPLRLEEVTLPVPGTSCAGPMLRNLPH